MSSPRGPTASAFAASRRQKTRVGDIELGQVLGSGGFGKVYLGHDTKHRIPVAVKCIDKALVKENNLEEYVTREIDMMRAIKHPHIVRLLQFIDDPKGFYLVLELAANGELFDRIVEARRFDEDVARRYFQQLISALWYCHGKNIVHRDLKAENLLLGEHDTLKVCDFGLSRYVVESNLEDHPVLFTSVAGSTDYQAPEVLDEHGYHGFTCDIWSCGAILFFMLTGYLPFAANDSSETLQRIRTAQYNKNDKHLRGAADLIQHILVVDIHARYTIQDIIMHPWFQVGLDLPTLFPGFNMNTSMGMGAPSCSMCSSATPGCASAPPRSPVTMGGFPGSPPSERAIPPAASPAIPNTPSFGVLNGDSFGGVGATGIMGGGDVVAILGAAFRACNVDGSGHLTRVELRDVLIKLNNNEPVPESDVDGVLRHFQLDADGSLSQEEFVQGWLQKGATIGEKLQLSKLVNIFHYDLEKQLLTELRAAFDELDNDHSGCLTLNNIRSLKGLALTEAEAEQLFLAMEAKTTERSHMHTIPFECFVNAVTKANLLKNHPVGRKLQRIGTIFNANDFGDAKNYLNSGFTVSGMRNVIEAKLKVEGQTAPFLTGIRQSLDNELFLYGTHRRSVNGNAVLEVGIQLRPAVPGYTKVMAYRISGRTDVFHEWFRMLRTVLRLEILACADDTRVTGESELM